MSTSFENRLIRRPISVVSKYDIGDLMTWESALAWSFVVAVKLTVPSAQPPITVASPIAAPMMP